MNRWAIAALSVVILISPLAMGSAGQQLAIEIAYLGLFAISFNLLFGYAGVLSFGHNAPFGVGAYAYALATAAWSGGGLLSGAAAALIAGALTGVVVAAISVRLRGSYLALLTLAVAQLLSIAALRWRSVTNGDDGLIVPDAALNLPGASWTLGTPLQIYGAVLAIAIVGAVALRFLLTTPWGNAVLLLRENPDRASALGYAVGPLRASVVVLASGLAGVAGAGFAMAQGVVTPSLFGIDFAGNVVIMTVLGGSRSFLGPLLGVAVYELLHEALGRVTNRWQFAMGLLLVVIVLAEPRGLSALVGRLTRRGAGAAS